MQRRPMETIKTSNSYYPRCRGLIIGEWINEFERQSLNRRNPSLLEPQLVKNVLAARDSPCINPLTFQMRVRQTEMILSSGT